VEYLVSIGVDINVDNNYVVQWESWNGYFEIVKYLVYVDDNINKVV